MSSRATFFALLLVVGCTEEKINPVTGPADAGVPPPDGSTPELPPDAPPVTRKRDVLQRNPFGNVAETQNLLWDGDFEWSSPFTDQYGWLELPTSPTITDVEVGPACKSGVKCARVRKNGAVVGIAVSSSQGLEASIWVHFEASAEQSPTCADVDAFLADIGASIGPRDPDLQLLPSSDTPDDDGWCQLTAASRARSNKTYLYVENNFDGPMLLDDCVIRPTAEIPLSQAPSHTLSPASRERAEIAVRVNRHPVDGAPNPARDAYRRFRAR